jgi:hypothetical protein
MLHGTAQPDISLVFADHEQIYYVIPVEIFERGRAPAAQRAAVEEALREHEVTGYSPILAGAGLIVCSAGPVGSGMMIGAGLTYGSIAAGKALRAY